jgi:hypothetical protein
MGVRILARRTFWTVLLSFMSPAMAGVNTAPILDPSQSLQLLPVNEDAPAPAGAVGTPVSSLVDLDSEQGGLDNVTDPDVNGQLGIAIIAADTFNGTWHFSQNSGTNWFSLGAVSDTNSFLLVASPTTRLYFRPAANFNGGVPAALTIRAWDRTAGEEATYVNTEETGGTTAYSADSDTVSLSVLSINDAPVLDASKSPVLLPIGKNSPLPVGAVGTSVSSLVDYLSPPGQLDNVVDPDASALLGIAVVAASATNGIWYYSIDNGGSWNLLGFVNNSAARLLTAAAGSRLYFHPSVDFTGTLATAITFRAWDRTTGNNGAGADTTVNGDASAFSAATDTASLEVVQELVFLNGFETPD